MTPGMPSCPAVPRRPRRRGVSWLEISLFLTGWGLFAVLLWTIGTAPVTEAVASLGPALGLIVAVEILAILANTLSWHYAIVRERRGDAPFGRLLAARIVGDALNYVIPAGVGEVARVRLLARHITTESAVASVALARVTEGIALGIFGLLGFLAAWPLVAADPARTVPIAVAALAGVGLLGSCLAAVRFGLIATVIRLFRRFATGPLAPSGPGMTTCANEEPRFEEGRRGSAIVSTAWHLVGWFVNVAELWLACYFLGLRPSLGGVVAGEALGALCDGVFFFVPMRIGAAEGGRVVLFTLLGLGAAQGLALSLVRRARELTWTAVGLAIYPWLAAQAPFGHRRRDTPKATTVSV